MIKKWLQSLTVSGISLLLTLILIEIGLRLFYPQYGGCQFGVEDPEIGVRLIPGYHGVCVGVAHESVTEVAISAQGFRSPAIEIPKPANVYRILMLGDSTTFGTGVTATDTVPALLQSALNKNLPASTTYEVINAGVPGYSTAQEWLLYKRHAQELEPDLVVLNFLVTNDIRDNLCIANDEPFRPCYAVEQGELVRLESAAANSISTVSGPVNNFTLEGLHTYVFLRQRLKNLVLGNPDMVRFLTDRGWQYDAGSLPPTLEAWYSPDFAPVGWELTHTILDSLHSDTQKDGVPFLLVILPGRPQTIESYARVTDLLYGDTPAGAEFHKDPQRPQTTLKQWADEQGVLVLDTLDSLKQMAAANSINLVDGHFNALGNQVIAHDIFTFVTENHLLS